MTENYRRSKAFAFSLFLHCVFFLLVSIFGVGLGIQSLGQSTPIDVVLYDADGDAGTAASDEPIVEPVVESVINPDDIVIENNITSKTEQRVIKTPSHTAQTGKSGVSGSQSTTAGGKSRGSGMSEGHGDKGTGGGGNSPPKERIKASLLSEAAPEYPQELIDDDIEGEVTIDIFVAPDGSVEDVSVVSFSGYRAMDKAAVAAGYRFRFNPGDDGRRGIWTKTFRFQLN